MHDQGGILRYGKSNIPSEILLVFEDGIVMASCTLLKTTPSHLYQPPIQFSGCRSIAWAAPSALLRCSEGSVGPPSAPRSASRATVYGLYEVLLRVPGRHVRVPLLLAPASAS